METQTTNNAPKKKLPRGVKILLGLAVGFVGFSVMASVAWHFFGKKFTEKGTEAITEKLLEQLLKEGGEEGKDLDVDFGEGGFSIKDEETGETQFAFKTGDVPRDFPADIPVFQPSAVVGSMMMGANKSLQLETNEPLEKVTAFYKKTMAERGWSEDLSAQAFGDQPYSTNWIKGQRQVAILATPPEDGKTLIILNTNEPSKEEAESDPSLQRVDEKEIKALQKDMRELIEEMNKMDKEPAPLE